MGFALVTGASAGLGRELARLFAADKHPLILVARRRDRLEELASELRGGHDATVHVLPADLAELGAAERLWDAVTALGVEVDTLVNNAGFGSNGAFADLPIERELSMIQLNVSALVHLTHLALGPMRARGSGRILNLGSTAGFQPGPFMATYYATKAFVNSFSEALAFELQGTGITVTVSCPGATATEFAELAGNDKSRLFRGGVADGPTIAREAYQAMKAGKRMIVHGAAQKVMLQSLRISPRAAVLSVVARLNRAE